jgi:hypothetical protein
MIGYCYCYYDSGNDKARTKIEFRLSINEFATAIATLYNTLVNHNYTRQTGKEMHNCTDQLTCECSSGYVIPP